MSERASTSWPRACSGERYWAVPITDWVAVIALVASAIARAIPKSMTFTVPSSVIMMLPGLMSRWTMPARWEYSSALSSAAMISPARWASIGCSGSMKARRVLPSTYSMTMKGMVTSAPVTVRCCSSPVS